MIYKCIVAVMVMLIAGNSLFCIDNNLIQNIMIHHNRITIIAHPAFLKEYLKEHYFVEYGPEVDVKQLSYSEATVGFIMYMAPLVWYSGKTYTVLEMDEDLYYSLQAIQTIFRTFFPSHPWTGQIVPKKLVQQTVQIQNDQPTTLTLFSGGLDAVYTVLKHYQTAQVLVTVYGSDIPLHQTHMWKAVNTANAQFAKEHHCEYTSVLSNFAYCVNVKKLNRLLPGVPNWWAKTSQMMTYAGLVAPIAMHRGCSKIMIGSTHTQAYPFPYGTHPLIDMNIVYAGISCVHDGADKTRTQKFADLASLCEQHHLTPPQIRVCFSYDDNGKNCSSCEKCIRTIMDLLVIKQDPTQYGFLIDVDEVLKKAARYSVPTNHSMADTEWHWLCIEQAYEQAVAEHGQAYFDEKLVAWFEQLRKLDLKSYVKNAHNHYSDATTKAYSELWHKALQGTFTLADLKYIPQN